MNGKQSMAAPDLFPEELREACDAAKDSLERGLDSLLGSFAHAQELGLDAGAILAARLRTSMGDAFEELPPMIRMLLG